MWQLEFRESPMGVSIRAATLDPRSWAELSEIEAARTLVWHGNRQDPAGELWNITRGPRTETPTLRLLGDWSSVDEIGSRLGGGEIIVEGNAGLHLGEGMTDGLIVVDGNAGDDAGRNLAGGRIHIKGNAGRFVGSASIGGKLGMTGGAILVEGNVGDEAGRKMRRGFIAVGGSCGDFVGASMIAGTILVFGRPGRNQGSGMKRGAIAYLGRCAIDEVEPLPTFRDNGVFSPLFLGLYLKQLREWSFPNVADAAVSRVRRWRGDLLEMGNGEILVAAAG